MGTDNYKVFSHKENGKFIYVNNRLKIAEEQNDYWNKLTQNVINSNKNNVLVIGSPLLINYILQNDSSTKLTYLYESQEYVDFISSAFKLDLENERLTRMVGNVAEKLKSIEEGSIDGVIVESLTQIKEDANEEQEFYFSSAFYQSIHRIMKKYSVVS